MEKKKSKKISSKKLRDDSFLFSTSLIFDENIDKLWLCFKDISFETSNIDFLDDFKYIKGDNTWTVGNKCSLYWIGVSHMTGKCTSITVDRTRKKIKWKFKMDIGISYYKTLILYRITQNGKTLVKICITRTEKKNNLIDISQSLNYYSNMQYNILLQLSKYLQTIKKDIILYDSCIINKNYLEIWGLISNLKNYSHLISDYMSNLEFKGSINAIGSFIKYFDTKLKKTVFLKIIVYDISNQKKCWTFTLEAIGTNIVNVPKISEIKLVIIDNNKVQISFLHKFDNNSDPEFIKNFDINKKDIFKRIIKNIEERQNEDKNNFKNNESNNNI